MLITVDATIDEQGNVKLLEPIHLSKPERAFEVIFNEEQTGSVTALLSEVALAEHWLRPEEEDAWEHLKHLSRKNCLIHLPIFRPISGKIETSYNTCKCWTRRSDFMSDYQQSVQWNSNDQDRQ